MFVIFFDKHPEFEDLMNEELDFAGDSQEMTLRLFINLIITHIFTNTVQEDSNEIVSNMFHYSPGKTNPFDVFSKSMQFYITKRNYIDFYYKNQREVIDKENDSFVNKIDDAAFSLALIQDGALAWREESLEDENFWIFTQKKEIKSFVTKLFSLLLTGDFEKEDI